MSAKADYSADEHRSSAMASTSGSGQSNAPQREAIASAAMSTGAPVSPSSETRHGTAQSGRDTSQPQGKSERGEPNRNGSNGQQQDEASLTSTVVTFVERNPVLATAAAFTVGAAIVMALRSRSAANNRLDRKIGRTARAVERSMSRELRAIRESELANRVGAAGGSVASALSSIDLKPFANQALEYLESMRNKLPR